MRRNDDDDVAAADDDEVAPSTDDILACPWTPASISCRVVTVNLRGTYCYDRL